MNAESQNPQGGHDVPLTPPSASTPPASEPSAFGAVPASSAQSVPETPRGSGARAGAIAIAVFGGAALLVTGGGAAFAATSDLGRSNDTQSVGVEGIKELDLEVDASGVTVQFGDAAEAVLEVTGSRDNDWKMERDGDELIVHNPDPGLGWWFGGDWFGDGGWFGGDESVVLTLPEDLRSAGLDAELTLDAGNLNIDGDFGDLDITVGAGALFVDGSATSIDVDVNAGRAVIELADVNDAELSVSAGRLTAELTGSAPDEVSIDVSAGNLTLTLPDEQYDVRQDVSAGSLDNQLDTSTSAPRSIVVAVSAGSATLTPGD